MIISNSLYIVLEFAVFTGVYLVSMLKSEWLFARRHWLMLVVGIYIGFIALSLNFKLIPIWVKLDMTNGLNWLNLGLSILSVWIIYRINKRRPQIINRMVKLIFPKEYPRYISIIMYCLFSVPPQELLFRWYVINRLTPLFNDNLIITLISSIIFGIAHIPFGSKAMVASTFVLGMWWSYLFMITGSIWPVIISHWLIGGYVLWLSISNQRKLV